MPELPNAWLDSRWAPRLRAAVEAVSSAGAALCALRGAHVEAREVETQLKTSVDLAAEGWVLGLLRGSFPEDRFLAEESHAAGHTWLGSKGADAPSSGEPYWTVDALDGTRSYVEGYAGFCVQVAYVEGGRPVFGAIDEPLARRCFVALEGGGAYELSRDGPCRLPPRVAADWTGLPRFVDSTLPRGVVGDLLREQSGQFVECGSIGLKACRVVQGAADVYAKAFRFRLWDVAPCEVLLRETACSLRLWSGAPIDYSGQSIEFSDLVAAPTGSMPALLARLGAPRSS
ncbi:MAG: inositol monophosphatase family protein [Deltaproteobacteria bacterium]